MKPSILDKISLLKETHTVISKALKRSLEKALNQSKTVSESDLKELWLAEIRREKRVCTQGWYQPPPKGICVLFANTKNPKRIDFPSLRQKDFWPNNDLELDKKDGIIVVYFSAVSKTFPVIGDFGLTIYLGRNKEYQNALRQCLDIDREIFDFAKTNVAFSEITSFANQLFKKHKLRNNVTSVTDKAYSDIGHTVPFIDEEPTKNELNVFKKNSNWQDVCDMISKKRKFLSAKENYVIKSPIAFTLEPRLTRINDKKFPSIYFHPIALFNSNGEKEFITNYKEIFKLTGMTYML